MSNMITLHPSVTINQALQMLRDYPAITRIDGNDRQRFLVTRSEQGNMGFVKVPKRKDQLSGLPCNPVESKN